MDTSQLICEIGSTTGSWAHVSHGQLREVIRTDGFNPVAHPMKALERAASFVFERFGPVDGIIYYGTGVMGGYRQGVLGTLQHVFGDTRIELHSDLLAAARACYGNAPGVVAILGTGSNCKIYDGNHLQEGIPSLGYPLGDEGSGWQIGLALIRAYYYRQMPADLSDHFAPLLPDSREELIAYVRGAPAPNRYLASFATFAGDHIRHDWISNTVRNCLKEFVDLHIAPLQPQGPVSFVGSIASAFEDILREIILHSGLECGVILKDPLESLIKYHLTNE